MAGVRLYTAVYIVLVVLALSKWAFFEFLEYNLALGLTIVSAFVKTTLIAAYYQHLRDEPRSLTYLYLMALTGVLLLTIAASYSIT